MTRSFDDLDPQVRECALRLWKDAGSPQGKEEDFVGRAQELTAIEENQMTATMPVSESLGPDAEPIEAVENQGEFPTLTDEGEEQTAPRREDGEKT